MNKLIEITYSKNPSNFGIHYDVMFSLTSIDDCNKHWYKVFKLYGEDLGLLEPISNEQLNDMLNKFKLELLSLVEDRSKLIDKLFDEFIDDFNNGALVCRQVNVRSIKK